MINSFFFGFRPASSVLVQYAGSLYRANVEHEQEGQVRGRL